MLLLLPAQSDDRCRCCPFSTRLSRVVQYHNFVYCIVETPSEWIESDPRNDIDIECIDHITRSDKYLYPGASTTQLNSTQLNQQRTHQGRYRYIHSLNLPISSPLSSFSNFFTRHSSNKNPAATMYATPAKTCVYK